MVSLYKLTDQQLQLKEMAERLKGFYAEEKKEAK